ncbi:MAG: hypothetical protein RIQ38_243 [Pseudomonadota bacterium]|jgi:DNA polymerase
MPDPTAFDLDARQRAMLEEMGVPVWWPAPAAAPASASAALTAAAPQPPAVAPLPSAQARAPEAVATRAPETVASRAPLAPAPVAMPVQAQAPHAQACQQMDWDTLAASVADCQACGLCQGRRQTVFGVGDRQAQWMVIGEAPGEQEDRQGEPFVGPAGQLLNNMLRAIGLARDAQGEGGVYIANTLKCRPPGNRNPEPAEMASCAPYLERQVALVQPRMILAMGRFAVQFLLQTQEPIGRLRGRVHRYQGVPVVVTYHPAYLLRNPADKARAWDDLCLAVQTAREASAQG